MIMQVRFHRYVAVIALMVTAAFARQEVNDGGLPEGATLAIRLEQTVRSDRVHPGDEVRAKLLAPVLMHGAIAIPANASILGTALHVQPLGPGRASQLLIRFHAARWRDGSMPLNAYISRQLLIKRTFTTESRQFCPPIERFLPRRQSSQQQQPAPAQQPAPQPPPQPPPAQPKAPAPPAYPPPRPRTENMDLCHNPIGTRREDLRRQTFTSPAISDILIRKLTVPEGGLLLESPKKNIKLPKGMMLEIRNSAP